MKQQINILVCCHKEDVKASDSPYYPIHVGKAISNINLNIPGDDSGDNISFKNPNYCELTGMYWAWKNLKGVDIIGLCHYRRYFDFHNQCRRFMPFENIPTRKFSTVDISVPQTILDKVSEGQIVVAKPLYYMHNLATEYCVAHISDDLRTLQHVIKATQPQEVVDTFHVVMYQNNALVPYNMFLMHWNDFNKYCEWLFPILSEVECQIDISHYNPVQARIYGYMAERLFNVWLKVNDSKIIHKPIIRFCDTNAAFMNPMHFAISQLRGNITTWLSKTNSRF